MQLLAIRAAGFTATVDACAQDGGQPLFVVLSREQAKLSYRWSPAVVERVASLL